MMQEITIRPKSNSDYKKSTQVLNFFASKEGGTINKMKAYKLLFLADRYHLRKHGRLVANDKYIAMSHGPVASRARDLAEHEQSDFIGDTEKNYANKYIGSKKPYDLISKKPPDEIVFSKSDLEALNYAWDHFGKLNQFELSFITHFYPEWSRHENALKINPQTSFEMEITDFFNEASANIDNCFDLTDQDKNVRRAHFEEQAYLESLWA